MEATKITHAYAAQTKTKRKRPNLWHGLANIRTWTDEELRINLAPKMNARSGTNNENRCHDEPTCLGVENTIRWGPSWKRMSSRKTILAGSTAQDGLIWFVHTANEHENQKFRSTAKTMEEQIAERGHQDLTAKINSGWGKILDLLTPGLGLQTRRGNKSQAKMDRQVMDRRKIRAGNRWAGTEIAEVWCTQASGRSLKNNSGKGFGSMRIGKILKLVLSKH
jgi:hypothetical protein